MRKKDTWHAPDPDLFHVAAEVVVLGTIKSLNCQTTVINYKLEKRERAEGILYIETIKSLSITIQVALQLIWIMWRPVIHPLKWIYWWMDLPQSQWGLVIWWVPPSQELAQRPPVCRKEDRWQGNYQTTNLTPQLDSICLKELKRLPWEIKVH